MSDLLRVVVELVSKFFGLLFAKTPSQSAPGPVQTTPPSEPVPVPPPPSPAPSPIPPPPSPAPSPIPPPPPVPPTQSDWWHGNYVITQPYGCTDLAIEGPNPNHPECPYFHEGIDFGMPCGTPIFAAVNAQIMALDPPGYGPPGDSAALAVRINNTQTIWLYHMANYAVHDGEYVAKGQLLGYSGTRGYSTGCHLHFEARPLGAPYRSSFDPSGLLHP